VVSVLRSAAVKKIVPILVHESINYFFVLQPS
jgi:hypothetical protein